MTIKEKITISGDQLLGKVKQLIHEGNIRRIRILHNDKTLLEVPLTIGAPAAAIGIMAAPVLAAVGALAALVTECTIEVERVEEKDSSSQKDEE
ncbi:MAG TPA: DUF4342 domain-containing protein [Dehalococcoidia bacterium]|nr:DUF4342 domain-containing protein [Dehalococcoidia bacterium]